MVTKGMGQLKHTLKSGNPEMPEGVMIYAASTAIADGTAGYDVGSIFINTAGTASHTLYVNEGSVTSSDFNRVMTIA